MLLSFAFPLLTELKTFLSLSSAVFSQLLQQVQMACRVVPSPRQVCSPERVTLFQLSVYLKRWSIQEVGEHISRLSREGISIILKVWTKILHLRYLEKLSLVENSSTKTLTAPLTH